MLYQTTDFFNNYLIVAGTRVFSDGTHKPVELAFYRELSNTETGPGPFISTTLAAALRLSRGCLGQATNWSAPRRDDWLYYKGRRGEQAYVLRQSFWAKETPEEDTAARFWVYTTFDVFTDASETFIFTAETPNDADWYFQKLCKAPHEVVISSLTPCNENPDSNLPVGFAEGERPAKG